MHALCIGRHPYLAEHLARFFARFGITTRWVVGLEEALRAADGPCPDLVLCEYDVLTTEPLAGLEQHPVLGRVPVMAVSLARRPEEVNLLDVNGIAGFLYLPTLRTEDAARIVGAARPPAAFTLASPLQPGARPLPAPNPW
ncbi:MAG TPA: hypothetical protein VFS08_12385 [Gemmatimonadaceae bacterium]|nr:hypothetical protein [Gemmatimonadaceae bacterium]